LRSGSSLLRPRDADALRAELGRVAEESSMPLTFGGEVHAQLRRLATQAPPTMRSQLRTLAERLAIATSGAAPPPCAPLTSRELDVLAQVALGTSEAAQRLSLKAEIVKSYLRSAAAKLGTRTRHEAVIKARRSRLIP
jgi:LuxR family transcriptional regulator, regulator of acetate metabolism